MHAPSPSVCSRIEEFASLQSLPRLRSQWIFALSWSWNASKGSLLVFHDGDGCCSIKLAVAFAETATQLRQLVRPELSTTDERTICFTQCSAAREEVSVAR
jgi:hypothetical protein